MKIDALQVLSFKWNPCRWSMMEYVMLMQSNQITQSHASHAIIIYKCLGNSNPFGSRNLIKSRENNMQICFHVHYKFTTQITNMTCQSPIYEYLQKVWSLTKFPRKEKISTYTNQLLINQIILNKKTNIIINYKIQNIIKIENILIIKNMYFLIIYFFIN